MRSVHERYPYGDLLECVEALMIVSWPEVADLINKQSRDRAIDRTGLRRATAFATSASAALVRLHREPGPVAIPFSERVPPTYASSGR